MSNPIDTVFARLRAAGRKAFIPFVTAGDPDLNATVRIVIELASRGASLIEIGFPYSDPIADGPVIQASYTRALAGRLCLDDIFATVKRLTAEPTVAAVPLAGMVSYSIIHRRGPETFLDQAKAAGLCGAIVPDLPVDEAAPLAALAAARDFKLVLLVTPTTPRERAVAIARCSTGFLYFVSITGITGVRDELPAGLIEQVRWLRSQTDLPICIGFGISKPEHVRRLREVADGVIVGSALVRILEQSGARPLDQVATDIGTLAQSLTAALEESP